MGDRDRVGTGLSSVDGNERASAPPWITTASLGRFLMADIHRIRPRSAIVVGGGIVAVSTAWFRQERGVAITVVDRTGVAAGASRGNAGWIAPALSFPLNDPRTLRYALRSFR